jgi:hydroxymethylglutaryl-CoA reductase (NADPH)
VGTVGGGTGLGTQKECLEILGCYGKGKAKKFAEIVASVVLAGEISIGASIVNGSFVAAHEAKGRNRPKE